MFNKIESSRLNYTYFGPSNGEKNTENKNLEVTEVKQDRDGSSNLPIKKRPLTIESVPNKKVNVIQNLPNELLPTIFQFITDDMSIKVHIEDERIPVENRLIPIGDCLKTVNKTWFETVLSCDLYRALIHGFKFTKAIPSNGLWTPLSLKKLEYVKTFVNHKKYDLLNFINLNSDMKKEVMHQLFYETISLIPNLSKVTNKWLYDELKLINEMWADFNNYCLYKTKTVDENKLYGNQKRFEKFICNTLVNGDTLSSFVKKNNKIINRNWKSNKTDAIIEIIVNEKIKFMDFFKGNWKSDPIIVFTSLQAPLKKGVTGPFLYIDKSFHKNEKYVIAALKQCDRSMKHLKNEKLKKSKEFTDIAFEICPHNYLYFDKKFKENREMALKAVQYDGDLLQFVSAELKNDIEIVNKAIERSCFAVLHIGKELYNDKKLFKKLALKAISINCIVLFRLPDYLKGDPDLIEEAKKQRPDILNQLNKFD